MTDLKPKSDPLVDPQPPIEIPLEAVSEEALAGIIDSFILREGTDYGAEEALMSTKVKQIRRQLTQREAKIVFDPNTDSVTILPTREFEKLIRPAQTMDSRVEPEP